MTRLTQREAARQWGRGRATIQRAIRAGSLTPDAEGRLDPADLLRVLGEPHGTAGDRPDGPPKTTAEPNGSEAELARLRAELAAAHALLDERTAAHAAVLAAKDETIAAMRLLTHDAPRHRRWWPF